MQNAPDIQQLRADALLHVDNKTWNSLPRLKAIVDKLIATYIDDPFVYRLHR
jgi:hypothetical protein